MWLRWLEGRAEVLMEEIRVSRASILVSSGSCLFFWLALDVSVCYPSKVSELVVITWSVAALIRGIGWSLDGRNQRCRWILVDLFSFDGKGTKVRLSYAHELDWVIFSSLVPELLFFLNLSYRIFAWRSKVSLKQLLNLLCVFLGSLG